MASHSSPESMWIKFFSDAGLPSGIGATYALTFTENRIQMNMLLDLNNEYLKEMGISCTGDVIAILRHAKLVHEKTARDRVLGITGPSVPVAAVSGRPGQPKATTPATRMLEHYTRNSPVNPSPATTSAMASVKERLGAIHITGTKRKVVTPGNHSSSPESSCGRGDAVLPTKHLRQSITQQSVHDEEATSPASDSKSSSQKKLSSSVFSRLGLNDDIRLSSSTFSSKITITVPKKNVTKTLTGNTVFARLGGKGDNLRRSSSDSNEPLKYEGILKGTPPKKKVVLNRTVNTEAVKPQKKGGTMRADEEPVSVREKLPISLQQRKSVKFSPHVDFKVIEKRPTANIPSQLPTLPIVRTVALSKVSTVVPVDKKIIKRTPISVSKSSVKMRLGKTDINKRSKSSVFGRLGITSRM